MPEPLSIQPETPLTIAGLTKRYGSFTAVDNVSLTVGSGEICAFIGKNGAGKTTTLRAVGGILSFDAGEIRIAGASIATEPERAKRSLAYIADEPELLPYLTGEQYIRFILDVFRVPAELRKERLTRYAAAFEMEGKLDRLIDSMSHGMRQKVALIAAFCHAPKLMLLDEPFVGLDPIAAHTLKELLREHAANGGAVLFSTHGLEVAQSLCERVAILQEGRLIAAGSMQEVTENASLENVFLELSRHA